MRHQPKAYEFSNFLSSKIIEINEGGKKKWRIVSKNGKNLGTFETKKAAIDRLKEIEHFSQQ